MKGITVYTGSPQRYVSERVAASYLGMTVREFRRECPVEPLLRARGKKVWDIDAVDRWSETNYMPMHNHDSIIARLS